MIGKHAPAERCERLMRPPPRELAQCSPGTQIIALQCVSGSKIGQGRWQRVDVDRFLEPAYRFAGVAALQMSDADPIEPVGEHRLSRADAPRLRQPFVHPGKAAGAAIEHLLCKAKLRK